jgi:intein/homing endonuclease
MPIEAVRVGDVVLAYDTVSGRASPGRVLRTFVHPYLEGSTLIRVNDQLAATPEHPFFRNGGWSPAGEIGLGDRLLRMEIGARGGPAFLDAPVTMVRSEVIRNDIAVYNLEIDELHDYFAGGVLVHNKPIQP